MTSPLHRAARPPGSGVGAPGPRAALAVVADPRMLRAQRRCRLATGLVSVAACFGLFGVVGLHVMLAQGQEDLQRLQARVQEETEHEQRLRLQVAELEAPARIVAAARQRLGMVPSPTVIVLAPTSLADPPPTTLPAPRPPSPPASTTRP